MSLLIKGMEMPKDRPVCIVIDAAGQARRYDLNNDRYADNKLFEAVTVLPHGRLIDADAMIHDIEKAITPSRYIKERNVDMVKFLSLEDTIIPADKEGDRE